MRISPILILIAAGCGPATENLRLTPTVLTPAAETAPIRLYSATQPRCPVEDVALITSQARDFTSEPKVLEGLRQEARRLGGEAVVQIRFLRQTVLTGTVVRFTNPDCKE